MKEFSPVWQDIFAEFGGSFIANIADDVHNEMRNELISGSPEINNILSGILSARGKCVRPVFMALIGELNGGKWESLRKAAMVIETIHQASILHDDVIDGASFRRGIPTLNATYSDKVSVLFGDFIFVTALKLAGNIGNPKAVSVVHDAVRKMIEGEIKDSMKTGVIDEDTYFDIISGKTAALFAASGELGAILSGADDEKIKWSSELGECLGIAFQIIDDSLDYNGSSIMMGKPSGMDLMTGNITLPLIHSLRGMGKDEVLALLNSDEFSNEKIAAIVHEKGGIDYSYCKALEYTQKAVDIVKRFDNEKMIIVFGNLLDYLINRTF